MTAAFQASLLEQVDPETPAQAGAGFGDNEVRVYAGQLAGDVALAPRISARAFFDVTHRDHDLDRSSAIFAPANGTQIAPFLEAYTRLDFGAEASHKLVEEEAS